MKISRFLKANSTSLLFTAGLGVLSLITSSYITYYTVQHETAIESLSTSTWALFYFYAITSITMALALTPTTFIALLSGYFLGWYAVLPVVFSYLIASWIGYQMARLLDNGRFIDTLTREEKVKRIVDNLKSNEFGIILMARLSPVLPFAISNVLLSLAGARLRYFMTAGFIGMLPRTVFTIWIGSQAKQIRVLLENKDGNHILQIGLALLVLVSLAGIYFYFKRAVAKANAG